jgi:molecular chaperone IbpA
MNYYNDPWDKWGPKKPDESYPHDVMGQKKAPAPKPITIDSVFPNLDRWAIGFDPFFETLKQLATSKTAAYPPCNIAKFDDGRYAITMAVAGFRRDNITILVEDRTLLVESHTADKKDEPEGKLIHQGIAQRDFTHTFALGEYVEVESAKMEDGMLTISLFTNIPEEKKPKSITID